MASPLQVSAPLPMEVTVNESESNQQNGYFVFEVDPHFFDNTDFRSSLEMVVSEFESNHWLETETPAS